MSKPKKSSIEVQGADITILAKEHGDYISLTDRVRNFEGGGALIEQWLKNKDTVLFPGVWEQIHNPGFNSLEFEGIRNEAGRNSFFLSAKEWIDRTRAKGLTASAGRYGGAFAGHSANARCVSSECLRHSANGECHRPTLPGNTLTVTLHCRIFTSDRPIGRCRWSI